MNRIALRRINESHLALTQAIMFLTDALALEKDAGYTMDLSDLREELETASKSYTAFLEKA